MPVPFMSSSMVSNSPVSCVENRLVHVTFVTPRFVMVAQLSGDMSMAVTSSPRRCSSKAWHPAPAPTSSTRPRDSFMALRSKRGMASNVRKRCDTGISSSSNTVDSTRRRAAWPVA